MQTALDTDYMRPPLKGTSLSNMQWCWRSDDYDSAAALMHYLDIPDMLAWVLTGRGQTCESAGHYLDAKLKHLLPDPFHLRDMSKAVDRIVSAIESGETIALFGDYDVDGATSTALMMRYFEMINVTPLFHIPDRQKEGYGPNAAALLSLQARGASLVITLDCGAVSFDSLREAAEAGLDVIVIDHHKGAAELPPAVAIVNPNRLDETSECTHLAAVGVAFLTLVALNKTLRERGFFASRSEPALLTLLDLVALGTVCDVVPLTTINRAFVIQGMKQLTARRNEGLRILLEQARVSLTDTISATHAGFVLGPRINAGGRVGSAALGTTLLTSHNEAEIRQAASLLCMYNDERKDIEQEVLKAALVQADKQTNHSVIMVHGDGWHPGVIGIVASRLKERYDRPAIVIACNGDIGKASARSVSGVDIGAAIVSAREQRVILEGGGHSMAGGFSVNTSQIGAAHDFFESQLTQHISQYTDTRALKIDAIINCAMVNASTAATLERAAPFGAGNPSPVLMLPDISVVALDVLKDQHVRLIVTDASKVRVKAMLFRAIGTPLGNALLDLNRRNATMHLAAGIKHEIWQNQPQTTLIVKDIMPT